MRVSATRYTVLITQHGFSWCVNALMTKQAHYRWMGYGGQVENLLIVQGDYQYCRSGERHWQGAVERHGLCPFSAGRGV